METSDSAPRRRAAGTPKLTRNVVRGVHWIEHAFVNCYIVQEGERWTLVDAGLPGTWPILEQALGVLDLSLDGLAGVVLTHGHFDHVGFAERLVRDHGATVHVHPGDARLAAHPYRYSRERNPLVYPFLYPRAVLSVGAMARAGAFSVRGVENTVPLPPSGPLGLPGAPEVLFTPGHTDGHCAIVLRDRDAVLSGDALVTFDPYKALRGPQIIAGAATADSETALRSLDAIAATGARAVLPGHGDPWFDGAEAAVAAARAVGPS